LGGEFNVQIIVLLDFLIKIIIFKTQLSVVANAIAMVIHGVS
jgi:hypothetical protein